MPEDAKARLRDALLEKALIRTRESIRLDMMAQNFESRGDFATAKAVRQVAHHNEVERIKLRAKLDALGDFV